jgi:hypothetical protein
MKARLLESLGFLIPINIAFCNWPTVHMPNLERLKILY